MDFDNENKIGLIAITFVVFLFSTACHEAAHAAMAYWWGDSTGKDAGQLTLNPFPHMRREPIGMLLVPLFLLLQSGGSMLMGWASTPVDKTQMRDQRWGDFWTSAAGPLTNMLLALTFLALLKIARSPLGVNLGDVQDAVKLLLWTGVWLNLLLMVLNFLPIPPLDGGHMLESLLPRNLAEPLEQLRPFGLIILLAVSYSGLLNSLVDPLIKWARSVL